MAADSKKQTSKEQTSKKQMGKEQIQGPHTQKRVGIVVGGLLAQASVEAAAVKNPEVNEEINVAWTRAQHMLEGLAAALPNFLIAVVAFAIFYGLSRVVRNIIHKVAARTGQPPGVALVFARIGAGLVIALGLLVAVTIVVPGLTAASLFSALGIGGVAIGFAFKDIFQNLLAGILILITRPFRIGDQIVSGEHEGTVTDILVRATILQTYDHRKVVIPNSELYTSRVTVNTAYPVRRLSVTVGIGYGDDIAKAKAVILRELAALPEILADPEPKVLVEELADFSVNLQVRYWISPPMQREVVESKDEVLSRLKPALVAAGIDLPFPTQQILLHDQTEETDGDRARQREGWPAPANAPAPKPRQKAELRSRGEAK